VAAELCAAEPYVIPDLTLFVKSPKLATPIVDAVDQLRRYHNVRKAAGEVDGCAGLRGA
jgi:hypothetical protein